MSTPTATVHPTTAMLAAQQRIVRLQRYLVRAEDQGKTTRAQMTLVALDQARAHLATLPDHPCSGCGRLTPAADLNDALRCDGCENAYLEASAEQDEPREQESQAATDAAWMLTVCDACAGSITGEPRLSKSGKRFCTPCADRLVAQFYAAHPERRPASAPQPRQSAYRIVTRDTTFTVAAHDDVVRSWAPNPPPSAPIGRWTLGQPLAKVLGYYTKKGAQITALAS